MGATMCCRSTAAAAAAACSAMVESTACCAAVMNELYVPPRRVALAHHGSWLMPHALLMRIRCLPVLVYITCVLRVCSSIQGTG